MAALRDRDDPLPIHQHMPPIENRVKVLEVKRFQSAVYRMETSLERRRRCREQSGPDCNPSVSSTNATAPLSRIGLKAGMHGLDKAKVNQVILEASKGSKFHDNELRKDEQISKRISSMMDKLSKVTDSQKTASLKEADREIELLEKTRDLSHVVVHVDMDAFYAAVEMRDNPELRNVPMAVGSNGMLVNNSDLGSKLAFTMFRAPGSTSRYNFYISMQNIVVTEKC